MRTDGCPPIPPRRRRLRVLSLPLRPEPLNASRRGELRRSLANWPDRVAPLHGVEGFFIGSALRGLETSGFFVSTGRFQPPARDPLLWPLLTPAPLSRGRSPQVRTQLSPAQPPHLPAGPNQTASLCGASSPGLVGLVCGSCSSACGSCLVFFQRAGRPDSLDFGWCLHVHC